MVKGICALERSMGVQQGETAMNKRLSFVASVFLASFALGIAGTGIAYAHDGDGEFRWLAATGMTEIGPLCALGTPCPDVGMEASNGDTIEIMGEGTLEIYDGDGDVSGGGSYTHKNASGMVLDVGSFTAIKLKSFESFGGSSATPPTWRLGRAQIRIRMVSEFDGATAKALLMVGCILPSPIERIPPNLIEGIRLRVKNGLNFHKAPLVDPDRATLFIELDHDD
jgi:hypothetical protein